MLYSFSTFIRSSVPLKKWELWCAHQSHVWQSREREEKGWPQPTCVQRSGPRCQGKQTLDHGAQNVWWIQGRNMQSNWIVAMRTTFPLSQNIDIPNHPHWKWTACAQTLYAKTSKRKEEKKTQLKSFHSRVRDASQKHMCAHHQGSPWQLQILSWRRGNPEGSRDEREKCGPNNSGGTP